LAAPLAPSSPDQSCAAWYDLAAADTLRQGDILRSLRVFWFPQDLAYCESQQPTSAQLSRVTADAETTKSDDWIILTASCDLEQGRVDQVLLARVIPATEETLGAPNEKEFLSRCEVIRRGLDPSKFLLAPSEQVVPRFSLAVVLFRQQVLLPIKYVLAQCSGARLRLRHPFREQLGNWAAACFSRVGPEDPTLIPRFRKDIHPAHILAAADAADTEPARNTQARSAAK
jgi:hypothetical protein